MTGNVVHKVCLACTEDMRQREVARQCNISRDSVSSLGGQKTAPLTVFPSNDDVLCSTGIIGGWLEGDFGVYRRQQHTAGRVFERPRDGEPLMASMPSPNRPLNQAQPSAWTVPV